MNKIAILDADDIYLTSVEADWWLVVLELARDISLADWPAVERLEREIHRSWNGIGPVNVVTRLTIAAIKQAERRKRYGVK